MASLSLRTRLLLLALTIVLPAILTGWLAMANAYRRESAALERTLRETTRALALVVDRELGLREALAWTLAGSPAVAAADLAPFREAAANATHRVGGWVVVTEHVEGTPPRQIVNTSAPPDAPLPSGGRLPRIDGSTVVVSDMFRGPLSGDWVIAVAVPSPYARGGARLSVSVAMQPERLQSVLSEQRLPPDWIASIIDRNGTIVARQPDPRRWVGEPGTPGTRRRIADGYEGAFVSTSLDGTDVTAYMSRSPTYGYTFAIGVPEAVRAASLRRSLTNVAFAALALAVVALAIAYAAARRVAAYAARLGDTARQLEAGRPAEYRPTGIGELDAIGRTLVSAGARIGESNDVLERRVAAAVAQTEQAQMQLAASQRLEALGRLTGGVAHDVNNLLGIIGNSAFVLHRLGESTRGAPQLRAIDRAVDTGRQLTRKLLAFSGTRAMRAEVIALRTWLPGSVSLARASLSARIEPTVAIDEDVPAVKVDAAELELALLNLAINADHAMPRGGGLVFSARRVAAVDSPLGVEAALIEVCDTGTGIAPALLDKVFEPFFTTKDVSRGSGLGLSQVYGFCTRSGGSVDIASEVDRGTTVSMWLPATAEAPAPPAPSGATARAGRAEPYRLLYVEDNDELAESTLGALQALGASVLRASNVADAQQMLWRGDVDVVVSDIVMPGALGGIDFALSLRVLRPTLPVILMTGYSSESTSARLAGFEVLEKPCPPEALHDAILRRLD